MKAFNFARLVIWFFLFGIASKVCSQPKNPRFEHITTRHGLSENSVRSICQDSEGFMWFGTWDGLNKYDGYSFTIFKHVPEDPQNSLRSVGINCIHEDKTGRLWIGTWRGLHQIDKKSNKIIFYHNSFLPNNEFSVNAVFYIYDDNNGILWLGTEAGIISFDPSSEKFAVYPSLDYGLVQVITQDPTGQFWVGSQKGLFQFNSQESQKVNPFPLDTELNKTTPAVLALFMDHDGVLWIGTEGAGIFYINTKSTPLIATLFPTDKNYLGRINSIVEDSVNNLWFATGNGLAQVNPSRNKITTFSSEPEKSTSLTSNYIHSLFLDMNGTLWIGTPNGINKLSAHKKPFYVYQVNPSITSSLHSENDIMAVAEDKYGTIWISTNLGLFGLDSTFKQVAFYPFNPMSPNKIIGNWVKAIFEDRAGRLWFGTNDALQLFDQISGKFTVYPFKHQNNYTRINEDPYGKLWIGGEKGIIVFDTAKKKYLDYFKHPNDLSTLQNGYYRGLMTSKTGDIWIETANRGIIRLNQKTGMLTNYTPDKNLNEGKINDDDINDIYEDNEGIIWIGTLQGGLNRFNTETGHFSYFTTRNGLSSNNIASITGDNKGNLWIGTNSGLSRFNIKTKSFHNFDLSDGLPDNEFNMQVYQQKNTKLLFGTKNGLVVFYPDSISSNSFRPPVHLTRIKVLEKTQPVTDKPIELTYSENFISFEYVALNYDAPEKNQYAYKLEGLNNEWINAETRRYASYSELSPGTYTFRVKGSNNDGVWNEQGDSMTIIIKPPWWRTWVAYAFYLIFFVIGVIVVDRIQRQKVINKERERSRQLEIEQALEIKKAYAELKSTQSQLIQSEKMASLGELTAGIAHEIQNPLNFVNNFAEVSNELIAELEEERAKNQVSRDEKLVSEILSDIKQNLEKINHHGKRADAIVKGMLQHSRTSSGQKEPTDINALADEYLRLAYHGLRAKDKSFNADFKTDFDPNLPKINVIPQDIGRVLLNLINNAFYAVDKRSKSNDPLTPEGGTKNDQIKYVPTVTVGTAFLNPPSGGRGVRVIVKDNGPGIPPHIADKIFQPFFTTKPTGQGTGLGLSLSYDIVKAHGGELKVETKEGEGTEFIVELPA